VYKYLFSTRSGQCTALDFCAKLTVTSMEILSSRLEKNMVNSAAQLLLYPRIASSASSEGGGEITGVYVILRFLLLGTHLGNSSSQSRLFAVQIPCRDL